MDIALHPHFNENKLVYFTYHKPPSPDNPHGFGGALTLGRGRLEGSTLTDVRDILSSGPSSASRIVFGNDGMLYMSIGVLDPPGGQGQLAQDTSSLGGKVLRLRDDGSIPPDNPFVDRPGYRPEIYTLGHRNVLGLGVNPETGDIWAVEAGPNGGDEINVLRPGQNFGHPVVGFGRFYAGPRVSESPSQEGMEPPIVFWVPGITPSGITFYTGERFPNWKGHVFVGGLQEGRVPRSGHLERIYFNPNWEEVHHEAILRQLQQRIRDVRQGPDGYLYLLTAESDGALIRVEPFKPTP
jgi:glucose/arabinose dehydrogenase